MVASDRTKHPDVIACYVSIPFIAGQWSLPGGSGPDSEEDRKSQSPSLRGSGRFSGEAEWPTVNQFSVSIPFIAGQWSLLMLQAAPAGAAQSSQSPSLRGSGRFARRSWPSAWRGQVSIPFIAGQWSLPGDGAHALDAQPVSQSPSLRGSGRFLARLRSQSEQIRKSQSPSLRGSGRFAAIMQLPLADFRVSIPFIAGQWSLQEAKLLEDLKAACLNPLHCGAVVASLTDRPSSI